MKINKELRELVRATPKHQITAYDAEITRAEREEAMAGLKADGWKLIAENDNFMKFAKVSRALGLMTTVLEYVDDEYDVADSVMNADNLVLRG